MVGSRVLPRQSDPLSHAYGIHGPCHEHAAAQRAQGTTDALDLTTVQSPVVTGTTTHLPTPTERCT